jgi:hypothetical protein
MRLSAVTSIFCEKLETAGPNENSPGSSEVMPPDPCRNCRFVSFLIAD